MALPKRIDERPYAGTLQGDDLFIVEQNVGTTKNHVKLTLQGLLDYLSTVIGGKSGQGSPEGVTTASPGTMYLDTDTENLWIKKTGTGTNTGWIQLIG